MIKSILLLTFIISSLNFAAANSCIQLIKGSVQVKWTAFKTPAKIGVTGFLRGIILEGPSSGKSIPIILSSSSFKLITNKKSIDSNNPARDAKIAKSFFSTLKNNGNITGSVSSLTKKNTVLNLKLNLNGVEKNLPLKLSIAKNELTATGHVDVLDYSMGSELAALNKACFAKHEGKTWSDVQVNLIAKFQNCTK
ncbi:MAG: hypothetical protein HN576_16090 [Bacteriovoracaceae bacterium]|nr:hypothetical protein [Bacteriovoracaceae bacterium]